MKKGFIINSILASMLLVACGANNPSSSSEDASSIESITSSEVIESHEVSNDEWSNALDAKNFENFAVSYASKANPTIGGSVLENPTKISIVDEYYVKYDHNNFYRDVKNVLMVLNLSNDDFHAYYEANEYLHMLNEEDAKLMYLEAMISTFGELAKLEQTENGYQISISESKLYEEYVIANSDPVLVDIYTCEEDEKLFHKTIEFNSSSLYSTVQVMTHISDLSDSYELASFDPEMKAYSLPIDAFIDLFQLDLEGMDVEIDGNCFLYFADSKLQKVHCVITQNSIQEGSVNAEITMKFDSFGDVVVNAPSNVVAHEHSETGSYYNEKYHFTYCVDCNSVLSYEEHDFDFYGVCETCHYEPIINEPLIHEGSTCEHCTFTKNKITGAVKYVNIEGMLCDYSDDISTYVCTDGDCDLKITEEIYCEQGETNCEQIYTLTYHFYDGDVEMRDPVIVTNHEYWHSYFIVEAHKIDTTRRDTVFEATIECQDCGKVLDCLLVLDDYDSYSDFFTICDENYFVIGSMEIGHVIENGYCIYCGQHEENLHLEENYKPIVDQEFTPCDYDEFMGRFCLDNVPSERFNAVLCTEYYGDNEKGYYYDFAFHYDKDLQEWAPNTDDDWSASSMDYLDLTAQKFIDTYGFEDKSFYNSVDYGKIEVNSEDGLTETYYFDSDGYLIGYESIYDIEDGFVSINNFSLTYSKVI